MHGRQVTLLRLLTLQFVLIGLAAMLWLSPKVPYADPWRFLDTLSRLPFPANLLQADNGHFEIVPSLIKWIELRWLDANQWLQVLAGAVFALAIFALLALTLGQARSEPRRHAAMLCVAALALFWLGNQRTRDWQLTPVTANRLGSPGFRVAFAADVDAGRRCWWIGKALLAAWRFPTVRRANAAGAAGCGVRRARMD